MVKIENLYKSFRNKDALCGIDLEMDNGVYGILGPNGAGKTTLMRCIAGLYDYKKGRVWINGEDTKKQRGNLSMIGYLPQQFGTYRELTVEETMEFFCVLKDIDRDEGRRQSDWALGKVNLEDQKRDKVRTLSGGMLRRLGIAQTLLGDPKVLIYDEPTAGLDPEERLRFKRIVAEIAENRVVMISTHIVDDVEALCNKIVVMNKGKTVRVGTSEMIANAAEGKVYRCLAKDITSEGSSHYVEKEYESEGKVFYRLLSQEELPFEKEKASIEDGYLCILKNI